MSHLNIMRPLFLWADMSGYMSACFSALHSSGQVDLHVVARDPSLGKSDAPFESSLFSSFPSTAIPDHSEHRYGAVCEVARKHSPTCLVVSGWAFKLYLKLIRSKEFKNLPVLLAMDNPWTGTFRQRLGIILLRSLVKRSNGVFVPGERGWSFAMKLGFTEDQIFKGLYGVDCEQAKKSYVLRCQKPDWPKRFLYIGRLVSIKGIETLVEGYEKYRQVEPDGWELVCAGKGELECMLQGKPGITLSGFVQPNAMTQTWADAGALVLPSRMDPWPLALVEAAAAGLPIIHSNEVGSAVEVVRSHFNGINFATNSPDSLANAFNYIHRNYDQMRTFGERSLSLANAYDVKFWCSRWIEALHAISTIRDV